MGKQIVTAIVAVADRQLWTGDVFTAEALRNIAAERHDMTFDEKSGELRYRGPLDIPVMSVPANPEAVWSLV